MSQVSDNNYSENSSFEINDADQPLYFENGPFREFMEETNNDPPSNSDNEQEEALNENTDFQ